MRLTIEQALEQAIAAHEEGKLQDAERLYRAILQSQPLHPDANHNLGVLASSVNNADAALPLFKTALEANPKIEQFWLSYIDALIKGQHYENAQQAYEQAKKQGLGVEKLNMLKARLASINEAINIDSENPSEEQVSRLLECYQSGRFIEAEKLAVSVTQEFPQHPFGWKALGAVLTAIGRESEALEPIQIAVALSPQDAEAHFNLGKTLKDLGRLDEALASYTQAIALKPDFLKAHFNLANTHEKLGRLDEALASYTQTIALKPDLAEAHSNLGVTLQELGRLDEAEASYDQAIALKPEYVEAHINLGLTLLELGRLDEAEASYNQAIALKPEHVEALHNLSIVQSCMNNLEAEIVSLQNILQVDADNYGLRAGVNLAICNFLEGDFEGSQKHLLSATKIQEKISSEFKNEKVYWKYLSGILSWHEKNYCNPCSLETDKNLFVIGESHSLASHHLRVQGSDSVMLCKAKLIKGCKQWHLGNSKKNKYKYQFESIFSSLPKYSEVLLAVGEIDCRLDSGIIRHKNKFPEKEIEEIVVDTIENYLAYIAKNNSDYQHAIIIQGVPCPNIDTGAYSEKQVAQLIEVIRKFNYELKNKSREKGFEFLDVHKLTDRGDGFSSAVWHIDTIHLSPAGFIEAWRRHVSGQECLKCF